MPTPNGTIEPTSAPRSDSLVRRAMDELAILRCLHRYCDVVDRSTFDGEHVVEEFRECLSADCSVDYGLGRPFQGVQAWIDYTKSLRRRSGFSHHQYTNHLIDIHGDEAVATMHGMATHWWADEPGYFLRAGALFTDRLRRDGERWLITSIRLQVRFVDDPRNRLALMFPDAGPAG